MVKSVTPWDPKRYPMIVVPQRLELSRVMRLADVLQGFTKQSQMYRSLDIHETTWTRRFESQGWRWESIVALCRVLGCSPEDLL